MNTSETTSDNTAPETATPGVSELSDGLGALLHCPFCGPGESHVDLWFDDCSKRWRVGCGRCGCSTGTHPTDRTPAPAVAAWNRRGPNKK